MRGQIPIQEPEQVKRADTEEKLITVSTERKKKMLLIGVLNLILLKRELKIRVSVS